MSKLIKCPHCGVEQDEEELIILDDFIAPDILMCGVCEQEFDIKYTRRDNNG